MCYTLQAEQSLNKYFVKHYDYNQSMCRICEYVLPRCHSNLVLYYSVGELSQEMGPGPFKNPSVQPILLAPSILLFFSVNIHQLGIIGLIFKRLHLIYLSWKFSFQPVKQPMLVFNCQIPHNKLVGGITKYFSQRLITEAHFE